MKPSERSPKATPKPRRAMDPVAAADAPPPRRRTRWSAERLLGPQFTTVLQHPGAFALEHAEGVPQEPGPAAGGRGRVLRAAVDRAAADPDVIALSHFDRPGGAAATRWRATSNGWCRGNRARSIGELSNFLAHRELIGWVLLATMIFFSSLAFTVLESAMTVIFLHRRRGAAPPLPGVRAAAVPVHPVPGHRPAAGDAGGRQPAGDRPGERRALRPHLVAARRVGRAAVPAGRGRRDLRADLGVPGDAGRAAARAAMR